MRRIAPAAVLAAIAALGLLIALLTADPPGVTLRADARPASPIKLKPGEQCFSLAVLPDDTRLVRLHVPGGKAAPTTARVQAEGMAPITSGPGVRRGSVPTAVEYRLSRPTAGEHGGAQLCTTAVGGRTVVLGEGPQASITLLGDPHGNWVSALPALADRAGFGRGTVLGSAALPLALLLFGIAWVLAVLEASGAGLRAEPVGRRSIVRVGAVGALVCAAFALTTPPFQAPDEMVHLQYAELLADQQALPQTTEQKGDITSPQGQAALFGVATGRVAFSPDRRPPWSAVEDRALDAKLKTLPSGGAVDSWTNASSQPPTYYAVVAVAQKIAGGSILDRLLIGRLISALLFGLAAAGAVAFAREAVPRAGGIAVAGGLLVATLPMFGFVGGSINPDALLVAVAAWMLAVLARILRRGPTVRLGLALGALVGLGMVSKVIFAGLLPAVALGAVVILVRGARKDGDLKTALLTVGAALGVAAAVALPYLGWAILSGRGLTFGPPGPPAPVFGIRENVTYAVELFAGQFGPVMDRINGSGPWNIWLSGLTGNLGWLDYGMPESTVHRLAWFWGALAVLAIIGLVRSARARRAIPVDAVVYLAAVLGIALLISRAGLTARLAGSIGFEQARYLLPLAAIGAGGVALGLRQLPSEKLREWGVAVVVVIGLLDGTAGLLITVGRYFA